MPNYTYRGIRAGGGLSSGVIEILDENGDRIRFLRHIRRHSEDMNWGYLGSGPAGTARSLLIEALGEDALCPTCQGMGCPACSEGHSGDNGYRPVPYLDFKLEVVGGWKGETFTITRNEILAWLANHPI